MTIDVTVNESNASVNVTEAQTPLTVTQKTYLVTVQDAEINVNVTEQPLSLLCATTVLEVAVAVSPVEASIVNAATLVQNFGEIPTDTDFIYTDGRLTSVVKDDETKILTYNGDGTLATTDDGTYLKTFNYTAGLLTSMVVTASGA